MNTHQKQVVENKRRFGPIRTMEQVYAEFYRRNPHERRVDQSYFHHLERAALRKVCKALETAA